MTKQEELLKQQLLAQLRTPDVKASFFHELGEVAAALRNVRLTPKDPPKEGPYGVRPKYTITTETEAQRNSIESLTARLDVLDKFLNTQVLKVPAGSNVDPKTLQSPGEIRHADKTVSVHPDYEKFLRTQSKQDQENHKKWESWAKEAQEWKHPDSPLPGTPREDLKKGISRLDLEPKKDNTLAWLDEDLLCEDA